MNDVVSDFIALDVETANADFASICSIGLVHFRSGNVFKSITILVDPEDEFDPINISIHGIRPEDVRGKPPMAKVFPAIAASLEDVVVVHHSAFDKTALTRAASKYGVSKLPCVWLDTVRVARRAWPHFKADGGGHGLARLAQEFGIQFRHHDAAEDARAAGLVLQLAMAETGLSIAGWIDRVERPILMPSGGDRSASGNPPGPLVGETIVFTGQLAFTRSQAKAVAIRAGCEVDGGVTQRTTILVVEDQDLRVTKGNEKSAKRRKAEKLILDGRPIRIVGESDFLRMTNGTV
jgi:DNA polymerase-3 subunit epsilon